MTQNVLIANPPMGIYKGNLNLGQTMYHVWLDFIHRTEAHTAKNVFTPRRSLNVFGRKAEQSSESPSKFAHRTLKRFLEDDTLDNLMLSSSGVHKDSDPLSIQAFYNQVELMDNSSYLLQRGSDIFLDVPKILRERNIVDAVNDIDCFPSSQKKELLDLALGATSEPLKITNTTAYSLESSADNNFSPSFIVANSWGRYISDRIILPMSYNVLAKYGLLNVLCSVATNNQTPQEIVVYPRVETDEWSPEMKNLLDDSIGADIFRYVAAKCHSTTRKSLSFNPATLKGGRKMVQLTGNLGACLDYELVDDDEVSAKVNEYLQKKQFAAGIELAEVRLREISKKINYFKKEGVFEKRKNELSRAFSSILNPLSVYTPTIVERIVYET